MLLKILWALLNSFAKIRKLSAPEARRELFRSRSFRVFVLLVLLFVIGIVSIKIRANSGLNPLVSTRLIPGQGKELVVVVHGWLGASDGMSGVMDAVREARPGADLLAVDMPAHTFSNASLAEISGELAEAIDRTTAAAPGYERVILVGHSVGALIVRKAYVYAQGMTEDLRGAQRRSPRKAWAAKTNRLVLLAGCNRGWSFEARPADMGWIRWKIFQGGERFLHLTGTGEFVLQARKGERFVSNLRLQWINMLNDKDCKASGIAPAIQLLGTQDDIVSAEDSKDVAVSKDFVFIRVPGTGHGSILDLKDAAYGATRKEQLLAALRAEKADDLRSRYGSAPRQENPTVTHLTLVLHGIRDIGEWTGAFEAPLKAAFVENPDAVTMDKSGYGYFSMLEFLLLPDRQKNVRWFMDQYTEIKAKYPNLKEFNFIGHSNGTYVLASALQRYETMVVDRVVFAGSVVRRDYDWKTLIRDGRVRSMKNYVASADWVVGWFPKVFQTLNFGDLGSAGFDGFLQNEGREHEVSFLPGGHSRALEADVRPSMVEFLTTGKDIAVPTLVTDQAFGVSLPARLCWLLWGILLVLLAVVLLIPLHFLIQGRRTVAILLFSGILGFLFFLMKTI